MLLNSPLVRQILKKAGMYTVSFLYSHSGAWCAGRFLSTPKNHTFRLGECRWKAGIFNEGWNEDNTYYPYYISNDDFSRVSTIRILRDSPQWAPKTLGKGGDGRKGLALADHDACDYARAGHCFRNLRRITRGEDDITYDRLF